MIKVLGMVQEQVEFYCEIDKEMRPILLSFLEDVGAEIDKRGLSKVTLEQVTEIVGTMPELHSRIESLGTKVKRSTDDVIRLFFALIHPDSPSVGLDVNSQITILLVALCNKVYAV